MDVAAFLLALVPIIWLVVMLLCSLEGRYRIVCPFVRACLRMVAPAGSADRDRLA